MKTMILNSDTLDQVVDFLNEKTRGKKYWSGLGCGEIKSVEDCPEVDWFRGVGTFERVFTVSFVGHHGKGLEVKYHHEGTCKIPDGNEFPFDFETIVSVDNGDVFIYEKDNYFVSKNGGTSIYMEWSEERHNKFKNKFVSG